MSDLLASPSKLSVRSFGATEFTRTTAAGKHQTRPRATAPGSLSAQRQAKAQRLLLATIEHAAEASSGFLI